MEMFKLVPAVKDYIWGGTRLRDEFGISSDSERIAEAWVLSCHPDGRSRVSGGEYDGKSLAGVLSKNQNFMGTHAKNFNQFPVMVKLINTNENLSVQVHPDDQYAIEEDHDHGKAEVLYIIDAEEDAEVIYGFKGEMTQEQFRAAILDGTLIDSLEHYKVEKGDVFYIEPGTVHSIGKGIIAAEIEQNSNTSYRIYDYGRVDDEGNPRELHTDKAIDVGITVPSYYKPGPERLPVDVDGREETLLRSCKYFTARLMEIEKFTSFEVDETSFAHVLVVGGEIKLKAGENTVTAAKGEAVFVPAGIGKVSVSGKGEFIVTTI